MDRTEALRLFADDILYEDFNYQKPFVGKPAVAAFVTAFDIPGLEFVALKVVVVVVVVVLYCVLCCVALHHITDISD